MIQRGAGESFTLFLFQKTNIKIFAKPIDKYNNMCYNIITGGKNMKSYSSREVIAMLKADGWELVSTEGSHHQYKHPTKKRQGYGKTPLQGHTAENLKKHRRTVGA